MVYTVRERKRCAEIRTLLGLELVKLVINKSSLRWFGHVQHRMMLVGEMTYDDGG